MRIAYLHGLESNNVGPKNDWLRTVSDVFDPQIDYRQKYIYRTLLEEVIRFKPDLIVGSSMGGYFAFNIAKDLNLAAILFNPALHSRSFEPDVSGMKIGTHRPHVHVVLGENDNVIRPADTVEILKREGFAHHSFFDHGHKTPFELFRKVIESHLKKAAGTLEV